MKKLSRHLNLSSSWYLSDVYMNIQVCGKHYLGLSYVSDNFKHTLYHISFVFFMRWILTIDGWRPICVQQSFRQNQDKHYSGTLVQILAFELLSAFLIHVSSIHFALKSQFVLFSIHTPPVWVKFAFRVPINWAVFLFYLAVLYINQNWSKSCTFSSHLVHQR